MFPQTIKTSPRISANKLGEYLVASPSRRKRIIAEQKKPKPFVVARYKEAQKAILEFLFNGQVTEFLHNEINALNEKPASSEWQAEDYALSAEAISMFLDLYPNINLKDCRLEKDISESSLLTIANVQVSVRPDVIVYSEKRKGEPSVGAIKLYFPKTNSLTGESGAYIATLLKKYLEYYYSIFGIPELRNCIVIDVFSQQIFSAPSSFTRRFRDIEAGCEEIARAWDSI